MKPDTVSHVLHRQREQALSSVSTQSRWQYPSILLSKASSSASLWALVCCSTCAQSSQLSNLFRGYKLHQNEDDLWCSINFDEVVVTLIDCRKREVIDQSAMLYVTRKHSCWSSGGSWTHWRPNTSFSKSTLGLYRESKLWVKMICFWCKAMTAVVHKPGLDDLQFNLYMATY